MSKSKVKNTKPLAASGPKSRLNMITIRGLSITWRRQLPSIYLLGVFRIRGPSSRERVLTSGESEWDFISADIRYLGRRTVRIDFVAHLSEYSPKIARVEKSLRHSSRYKRSTQPGYKVYPDADKVDSIIHSLQIYRLSSSLQQSSHFPLQVSDRSSYQVFRHLLEHSYVPIQAFTRDEESCHQLLRAMSSSSVIASLSG
jgi:hypothetical protein